MYVDECGLDETLEREYGWQTIGQRVLGEVQGKKPNRTSLIAGLNQGNPIAPFYFEGYCNTEVVLTWITEVLVPELKPGQIIVWDNASFHQSKELENAIHQAGCHLLFLPPYSPDLNPIEHFWNTLKSWIRKIRTQTMTLQQAICLAFSNSSCFLK